MNDKYVLERLDDWAGSELPEADRQAVEFHLAVCAGCRAEELTQDVFVRAWEKLHLYRGESAFSTWLHRLAVNVVLNERKTDGRSRKRDGGGDEVVDALPSLPTAPGDRMDLEAAIAKLPPGARRVFLLHDVEGYKHEEIAEMLGVTSGGSKAQLHRARMLLREALTR